jgi:molecular chaperone GrpE
MSMNAEHKDSTGTSPKKTPGTSRQKSESAKEEAPAARADRTYRKVQESTEPKARRKTREPGGEKSTVEAKPAPETKPDTGASRIKELERRIAELEDRYIRLRAEYDNYIKRTQREKDELLIYSAADVLRKILPVLDDFRRTLGAVAESHDSPDDDPVVQGILMLYNKLIKVLESEGVHSYPSVGEAFDPNLHEAMMTRSSDDHPQGYVIEEFEPGFKYRDRVLRHAKVVVSE